MIIPESMMIQYSQTYVNRRCKQAYYRKQTSKYLYYYKESWNRARKKLGKEEERSMTVEIVIRCSFIDPSTGEFCKNDAVYWIGKNEVDNYTYCCEDHLIEMRREDDMVRKL